MTTHIEPEYQKLLAAWQRAEMIPQIDPAEWRKDRAGRMMRFNDYKRPTPYGWCEMAIEPRARRPAELHFEALQYESMPKLQPKAG